VIRWPESSDFHETENVMTRRTGKLIHQGRYAAEIPIELIEDDTGWSPYLSVEDATKLDTVRKALQEGDVAAAAKYGRIFALVPVAG
jgi:hypothetical protein